MLHAPPFPLEGFEVELAWHERHRHDPAHAWFRGLAEEVSRATESVTG